jgi:hypothetical protein
MIDPDHTIQLRRLGLLHEHALAPGLFDALPQSELHLLEDENVLAQMDWTKIAVISAAISSYYESDVWFGFTNGSALRT